jgi:cystathionine beta-lyase/cystathionine gamma-synthase
MSRAYKRLETKLIHAGEPLPRIEGAVEIPIFQSAMFEYGGETSYHALKYIRLNNTPNHTALHAKIAALENAEAALVTASGMAAVSATFLTVLSAGDHVLAQKLPVWRYARSGHPRFPEIWHRVRLHRRG